MKSNGRRNVSFSIYDRHLEVVKRLAAQSQLTDSEIIRELIEAAANCEAVWEGPFLRLQRPKFKWESEGRYL